MSKREKGPGEIFCRSCGEAIKKEAEICPECGVRNQKATKSTSEQSRSSGSKSQHDPSQYETNVSENWWYGVLAGGALWILIFVGISFVPEGGPLSAIFGFLALIAWAIMPVAVYYDSKYVRANSKWNPSSGLWIVGMLIWLVNIIAGIVYLYRRHETIGTP